jgi:hypothetical protein
MLHSFLQSHGSSSIAWVWRFTVSRQTSDMLLL